MTIGFKEFRPGEGDEGIGRRNRVFKGEGGKTYRVSFVHLPVENGLLDFSKPPKFVSAPRIYIPDVGYVLYQGPEYAKFGTVKQHVATLICLWPMTAKGTVDADAFGKGDGYRVCSWVFSPEKYEILKTNNLEFPFTEHDFNLHFTDTQYQKVHFSPCRDNFIRGLHEKRKKTKLNEPMEDMLQDIVAQVADLRETLNDDLARVMSVQDIQQKIGSADGAPVQASADNVDEMLDDLLGG
jgi:hypothetical protein